MEKKKTLKESSVFYSVNPKTLSIKACDSSEYSKHDCSTTTYENFSVDKHDHSSPVAMDNLPVKKNGLWYFRTQDEALDFIKFQIGI